MKTAVQNPREKLTNAVKASLARLLITQTAISVGRAIGYRDGAMIYKMQAGEKLPGPVHLMLLSRFCSARGDDALADLFSADDKRTLPLPLGLLADGDIREEVMALVNNLGEVIRLDAQGRYQEAESEARRLVMAAQALRLEEEMKCFGSASSDGQARTYHELLYDCV